MEKERLSVKRCCYFYNIEKTREDSQTVLLYELHRTKKGKTKTMLFYKAFSKTVTLYLLLLYVLYRRDRGIQSLKLCCYYLLNRADKKILLVNLCCNIYCIVRSTVVWMLQNVCIAKIVHQRKEEKIPIMMDDLIHNEGTDECLLN